jgi:formylglycine-generating enzyme required for sulfatase activity
VYIFISYSHVDSPYAHLLAAALEQVGFTAWIDDRIDYGTQWPRVIQEQLDACAVFIVIMTPRAYASDWVQSELSRAKRKKKPIFPLLLEGQEPWLSVESTQYVDVRGGTLPPPRFYEQLAQHVQRRERFAPNPILTTAQVLPMLEWRDIPAGRVDVFRLRAFRISKYPITNQQYQVFADSSDGYKDPTWWEFSALAHAWRAKHPEAAPPGFSGDGLPRETVCWYEAIAFCRWLSHRTGLSITLPTEQQWQRAAQGSDKREYPWGSAFEPGRCNAGNLLNHTTPVDCYPDGASPFGVQDMAGNVWEWCLTVFESGDNDMLSNMPRVVRGGAWPSDLSAGCLSFREAIAPDIRINHIGFRVVSVMTD